jgi:hypothetical protein
MSDTMPPLEPEIVEDDDDAAAAVELSAAGPVEEEAAADVSDSAGTVVTPGWVMLPKLAAPFPPPQAERVPVRASVRARHMVAPSLARASGDVTCDLLSDGR